MHRFFPVLCLAACIGGRPLDDMVWIETGDWVSCWDGREASGLARLHEGGVQVVVEPGSDAYTIEGAEVVSGATVVTEDIGPTRAVWQLTPDGDTVPIEVRVGLDCVQGDTAAPAWMLSVVPNQLSEKSWTSMALSPKF